jgi:DNA polymerase-3 subunit alpha
MEYIDEYVARKHGRAWTTPHPIMTEVLQETYGIMVYQEQVSRLVARLGDVPLRRAFRLAKAISKKKESMINAERGPFIDGCVAKGVSKEIAEQIFADILKFGGYAFNKAHSTGYARVAFDTAYLKTYYPVEFMAAILTYESGNTDKVAEYLDECRRIELPDGGKGIAVKPPDVNESDEAFTVVYPNAREGKAVGRGEIRFGLAAISGLGHKAIDAILTARRKAGRFRDIFDFCERVDLSCVNKAAIEALIKAGAFDSTGAMRRALIEVVDSAVQHGQSMQRDRNAGQMDMFGQFLGGAAAPPPPSIPTIEWSDAEMLAYEKATLGFFITKHPLTQYEQLLRTFSTCDTLGLRQLPADAQVTLGAIISKVRSVPIKTGRSAGKKLLIAVLEDFVGSIEAVIFPDQTPEIQPLLKPDAVVFVQGQVDRRREEPSLRVSRAVPVEAAQRELAQGVLLRVPSSLEPSSLDRVVTVCGQHRGKAPVFVEIRGGDGWLATIRAGRRTQIDPTDDALRAIGEILGPENVLCCGPRGAVAHRA